MNRLRLSLIVILLVAAMPIAFAANELFYLRGSSDQTTVGGTGYYKVNFIPADSTSAKTTISKTTSSGVHEFYSWYGPPSTIDFMIGGPIFVYFTSIVIQGDTGQYRWRVYERDEATGTEALIGGSDWYTIPTTASPHETYASISSGTIEAGNRGKFVLEYSANAGGGTMTTVLDEGSAGSSVEYEAPNGNSYVVSGVKNTAYVLVNTSGSCSIACTTNSACSDGNPATDDLCFNAGGCNSYCSTGLAGGTIECSSNSECNDSNSSTTDTCTNPGTANSNCVNQTSSPVTGGPVELGDDDEIICSDNPQCNDSDATTTDTCVNPGTTGSRCSNAGCKVACTSNESCDDGDSLTNDACVNPGTCDAACNNNSCNPLCSGNSDCNDGNSETLDVCAGAGRCTAVCENLTACGDGVCGAGESECSCAVDCGSCGGSISDIYELACIGNNCQSTIKLGVCGNNRCEASEDFFICAKDCRPESLSIEADFPDTVYVRGESVKVKAKIVVDDEPVSGALVRAKGFFGDIPLLNDGRHDDGTRNDNVYANTFTIDSKALKALYPVTITAELGGVLKKKTVFLNMVPKLSFTVVFDKEFYILGDNLAFIANLNRKQAPLNLSVDLNYTYEGELVKKDTIRADNGNFKGEHRTTLIDRDGNYLLTMSAIDANNNSGLYEKAVVVLNPDATNFLFVGITVDENRLYSKGEPIPITVSVKDITGGKIGEATVMGRTDSGLSFRLEENDSAEYSGEFTVPQQTQSGELKISVSAAKQSKQGAAEAVVNITSSKVNLEVIEPKEHSTHQIGEEIRFRVKATYDNGDPIITESIQVTVGNEAIELRGVENGVYAGTYVVKQADEGNLSIKIVFDDGYSNAAEQAIEVEASGTSYQFYLRSYGLSILLFAVAVIIVGVFAVSFIKKLTGVQSLKKKEKRLLETIKGIQTQYFVEGSMDKKTYDEQMEKYESQLEEVRQTIRQLSKGKK